MKEKYSRHIFAKNGISIGKKPERGVRPLWNLACTQILWSSEKTLKITFWSQAPFIVKMDFEIWRYLHSFFPSPNIWSCVLMLVVNSSPNARRRVSELKSIVTLITCSSHLVHKYILKVKLNKYWRPNILSEIMRFQENGSRGKHFA